jgi:hypothetical protein
MRCAACNADVTIASGERVGFRDSCDGCGADLHSCLNCAHHDASAYNECRESSAERVNARDRANRCEWFSPTESGPGRGRNPGGVNRDALNALFKKP